MKPVAWQYRYASGPWNYVTQPNRPALGEDVECVALYAGPVAPEGWKLVPKEPTEEMLVAGLKYCEPIGSLINWREGFGRDEMRETLRRIFAAAPKQDEA